MKVLAAYAADLAVKQAAAEFHRYGRTLMQAKGDPYDAITIAERTRAPERVQNVLKAAARWGGIDLGLIRKDVNPGTTSDGQFASALVPYRNLADAFLETLRTAGVFDAAAPFMQPLPFKTNFAISTSGATAYTHEEGAAKPVTLTQTTSLAIEPATIVALMAMSASLLDHGTAVESIIGRELRSAVAVETDRNFLAEIVDSVSVLQSSGETAAAFMADLRLLIGALTIGAGARVFVAVHPAIAKSVALFTTMDGEPVHPDMTLTGGSIGGVTIIATDGLDEGVMVAFDATQFMANTGTVVLTASREATLQMSDTPGAGAQAQTSLFQANLVALKAERLYGFRRGRTTAVATMEGASYNDVASGEV